MNAHTPPPRPLVRPAFALIAAVALGLGIAPRVQAQSANPPDRLTFQGFLVDANGTPLGTNAPKNYDIIFRIWKGESTTAAIDRLWTEQQTVTVDRGNFSVLLGEGSSIGEARPVLSTIFTNSDASDRWVGITVKGIGPSQTDVNILPRLRLLTTPYAFLATKAITVASVDGATVSTGTVSDGRLSSNVALRAGGNTFTGNQIFNSGNVGIGKTPSAGNLDVQGSFNVGNVNGSFQFNGHPPGAGAVLLNTLIGANNRGPQMRFSGPAGGGWYDIGQNDNDDFVIERNDGARLTITPNGNIGIGTTTPTAPLHLSHLNGDTWDIILADEGVLNPSYRRSGLRQSASGFFEVSSSININQGFARLNGVGQWSAQSDRRTKKDIAPAAGLLSGLLKLAPVNYRFETQKDDEPLNLGMIAQDVREVFPNLVEGRDSDLLTLDYSGLSVVAVGAIQELHRELQKKDAEIETMRARLKELEEREKSHDDRLATLEKLVKQNAGVQQARFDHNAPETK